ncbi:unnamed protein product [Schistosoma margrebowiei]|uniref:Uncharacterized protein n=1 Tax=Schistosoma margrebowiei TaxID=48269 RepID=A0A183MGV8_9TREM|nr:unnamed protein product [Schistosoma margrebowiei]
MEEYNWKDTNMALFGSDEERSIKKEAAKTEKAWQQIKSIRKSTLLVWRINKFNLEVVKSEDIGTFYSGDSYIVLNIEKVGDDYNYDVHFWIGKKSTQDEYVTAAYKTVELDTFLDDKAIQHREVDGLESKQFKKYFKKFRTLEGGYDSGFNHTKPNEFKTRLMHFRDIDCSHVELREVPYSRNSLVSEDVFILDLGSLAYQWIGSKSGKYERFKEKTASVAAASTAVGLNTHKGKCKILRYKTTCANRITLDGKDFEDVKTFTYLGSIIDEHSGSDEDVKGQVDKARATYLQLKNIWNSKQLSANSKSAEYLLKLKSERNGRCKIQVLEENENSHELKEFLAKLPNTEITAPSKNNCGMKAVHRLSDEDGEMKLSLVCKEVLPRSVITQDDVYFIDNGSHLYVYIGDQCSTQEKRNALSNAHEYLKETDHPLVPISVVCGSEKLTLLNNVLE